ncbi:hypothetical protein MRB53_037576 [Persea americana]|nr:hypothetical protein MRB53_037576 [Persea americana]
MKSMSERGIDNMIASKRATTTIRSHYLFNHAMFRRSRGRCDARLDQESVDYRHTHIRISLLFGLVNFLFACVHALHLLIARDAGSIVLISIARREAFRVCFATQRPSACSRHASERPCGSSTVTGMCSAVRAFLPDRDAFSSVPDKRLWLKPGQKYTFGRKNDAEAAERERKAGQATPHMLMHQQDTSR